MECLEPWLSERFWPDLRALADGSPEPPPDVPGRFRSALADPPSPEERSRWAARGLGRSTGLGDTHPSFVDRARSLGLAPEDFRRAGFPPPARPSAAETFLGPDLGPIERELDRDWRMGELAAWRERHRRAGSRARQAGRSATAHASATTPEAVAALWEAAREEVDLRGLPAAAPLLRSILDADPEHAGAAVLLGHHLLAAADPEGEGLLGRVVERGDEHWATRAGEALQDHYRATGRLDRLAEARARLDRLELEVVAAREERSRVGPRDPLLPHGLGDEELATVRRLLASEPGCGAAWLARKGLRHFPRRPLFLLCVRGTSSRWPFGHVERDQALARRLIARVELPGQVFVLSRRGSYRRLADRITRMAGSEVFRRGEAGGPGGTSGA